MSKVCPSCAETIIQPFGDDESEILFIGSEPTDEELKFVRPFTGQVYHIWRKELMKHAHIDLAQTRQVMLWFHKKSKKVDCLNVSLSLVEKELEGKKFVVLVGADAVSHFTGLSVSNCNGLDVTSEVAPELVDGLDRKFFAISHPNILFRSLGELRFGLQQLDKWYRES